MSYSFQINGKSKDEVRTKFTQALGKIVQSQPDHSKDQAAVSSAVSSFLDLMTLPQGKDMTVSVYGSIWDPDGAVTKFSFGITVDETESDGATG